MSEHYFTAAPSSPAQEHNHVFDIRGHRFTVTTAAGVFCPGRVDKGTQVLLDHVPDPPHSGTLVDLGCGWGPITLALAHAAPHAHVLAVDVNERSLNLTARNARAAGATTVTTMQADAALEHLRTSGEGIDCLWSNPPVRVGKAVLHDLLSSWLPLLSARGEAWLVVAKNLGADSLARWLAGEGYDVSKETSSKGFRVLRVRHADTVL